MVVFSPVAQQPSSGIEDRLQAIQEILRRADQQTVDKNSSMYASIHTYDVRYSLAETIIPTRSFVVRYLYRCGSQPFPTRGPLEKFCLGSRTTKKRLHLLGKFLNF